jgi:hypothetical protein
VFLDKIKTVAFTDEKGMTVTVPAPGYISDAPRELHCGEFTDLYLYATIDRTSGIGAGILLKRDGTWTHYRTLIAPSTHPLPQWEMINNMIQPRGGASAGQKMAIARWALGIDPPYGLPPGNLLVHMAIGPNPTIPPDKVREYALRAVAFPPTA